jgi:hypothetical protein
MRWTGQVAQIVENRNAYRILAGNPGEKRQLGIPRHRWMDNIKMDLGEIGWDGVDWIELAQDMDQWRAYDVPPGRPEYKKSITGQRLAIVAPGMKV